MSNKNVHTPVEPAEALISTNVSVSGRVTEREQERAVQAVEAALHGIDEPVLRCTIRLEHQTDPRHARLATVRLSVDIAGTPIHAHADAETVDNAVDTASLRLHERVRRHTDRQQAERRRGASSPEGEWRHGDEKQAPHPYFDRPRDERQVERHVSFAPAGSTIDEAIFDLEALQFDFLLFVDDASGDDAVIWRDDERPGTHVVRFAHGIGLEGSLADHGIAMPTGVEVDEQPLPVLEIDAARDLLDIGELPRVSFRDTATDRGQVLHHRYDGHLGLVFPGA